MEVLAVRGGHASRELSPHPVKLTEHLSFFFNRENALEDKLLFHWKSENNTISEVNGTKVFSYGKNIQAVILF